MPADALNLQHEDFQETAPPARGGGGLLIRFFLKPFRELVDVEVAPGKTEKQMRWVKREMVEKRVPGDRTNAPVKIVTDAIRREFPQQYAAWKAGEDQETAGGMPLETWPGVDVAQVEELRGRRVRTVEQLAGMSDANLANLGPGWRQVRQAAIDWLEAAKSAAPMAALRAENNEIRLQLEAAQRQMQDMANAIKELKKKKEA